MKRRDFLKRAMQLTAAGLLLPPVGRRGLLRAANDGALKALRDIAVLDDKILVLVNLSGGNDGLSSVVPVTDPLYYAARPTLAIPPEQTLPLSSTLGLNSALAPMHALYDSGRLAVVQGVGYPQPNLSHFRSTDIWFSGSASDEVIDTGWLARFIEAVFPDFPNELPYAPYGLQQRLGHDIPLQGDRGMIGVVVHNPDTFFQLVNQNYTGEWNDELPDTRGGEELAFVREVDIATFEYAEAIAEAAEAGVNTVAYPETTLGVQLEIVARLISGQLDTPIFLTAEFGFDTHVGQQSPHTNLMYSIGQSVGAFFGDLDNQGLSDRVLLATVSEFGRRVYENGGFGTDHGTAAPIFVAGAGVRGGIYGGNPDLANLDNNGNMQHEHDFRSVYSTILRGHFGVDEEIAAGVLMGEFESVGFLDVSTGLADAPPPSGNRLYGAIPNPASLSRSGSVVLLFDLARPERVEMRLFDVRGREVSHLGARRLPAGRHRFVWEPGDRAAGIYLARISAGAWRATEKVLVVP